MMQRETYRAWQERYHDNASSISDKSNSFLSGNVIDATMAGGGVWRFAEKPLQRLRQMLWRVMVHAWQIE